MGGVIADVSGLPPQAASGTVDQSVLGASVNKRVSIEPTYDSRITGPPYTVTTRIGDETLTFEKPIPDPFVTQRVVVGWPDLLRALMRRRLEVTVIVGGDRDRIDDVLELDANWLGANNTRRDAFNADLSRALAGVAVDVGLAEMLGEDDEDD